MIMLGKVNRKEAVVYISCAVVDEQGEFASSPMADDEHVTETDRTRRMTRTVWLNSLKRHSTCCGCSAAWLALHCGLVPRR